MKNCYIYTRVSTVAQTEGYSLDAQLEAIREYANYRELRIVGEYCDAGKSGKNIKGRPAFMQMMEDVVSQKDEVSFVLVFKLSRFGRNAADILKSVQTLSDFGVDLVSVNEAIDSSTPGGRLTLAILSAVAEMERENITVQFMAGRIQKVLSGDWVGGTVPYGYRNINHKLVPDAYEAEVIQKVFELYMQEGSNATSVANLLNTSSYERRDMANGGTKPFTYEFVARTLDNPFYCGRLYFNRRTNKKDHNGKPIKYDADHAIMVQGNHEAVVSEELWDMAQEKRIKVAEKNKKSATSVYVHVLSGIVKCPVCGKGLTGEVSKSKNYINGGFYKPIHYYVCRHSRKQNGKTCSFEKRLNQEIIDGLVYEILSKLQYYKEFRESLEKAIGATDSVESQEQKLKELREQLRNAEFNKNRLGEQLDGLNSLKAGYDKKYGQISAKLDEAYDLIDALEDEIGKTRKMLEALRTKSETYTNVTVFLENLKSMLDMMTAEDKKELCGMFIDQIELFEEDRVDGKVIKRISFKFPLAFDGKELKTDNKDGMITFSMDCSDIDIELPVKGDIVMETMKDGSQKVIVRKPTYAAIKKYVKEHYGANIHTLYIAQIKRKYGLDMGENFHKPKDPDVRVAKCPKDKELMILDALKHFDLIDEATEYKEGEDK